MKYFHFLLFLASFFLFACKGDLYDDISLRDLPSYYDQAVNECIQKINQELSSSSSATPLVYITDTHWNNNFRKSPIIVKRIVEMTDIDVCLFGGDVIAGSYHDAYEAVKWGESFQSAFSFLGSNLVSVFGNHDDNSVEQDDLQEKLSEDEVYGFLQYQMASNTLTYGDYFYFYKDDVQSKTRYIGLDTGKFEISNDEWQFVVNALKTTTEGWHIVIFTHVLEYGEGNRPAYIQILLGLLDAYNGRMAGELDGTNIQYDFTNCLGRVEFCLGGHIHKDSFYRSASGIPCITTDCDAKNTFSGIVATEGTINEQCVTAIVADYENNVIHCHRVGRGASKDFMIKE